MTLNTRHVWAAYGTVAVAMLVTYSRIDPRLLYHVSGHGFVHGGLSRVLVDGAMLAATALVLRRAVRGPLGRGSVALMFAYGLVNCVQDAWTEQVVKRGWASVTIPDALQPRPNAVWGVIVGLAAAAYVLDNRLDGRRQDGLPRFWQVRARGPHLRARAARGR